MVTNEEHQKMRVVKDSPVHRPDTKVRSSKNRLTGYRTTGGSKVTLQRETDDYASHSVSLFL